MSRLHNHRHPAGLERVILRKLPKILLGGIFIPIFMVIFVRLIPLSGTATEIAKYQISVDILAISLIFMVCSAAFTVTIGCVIVMLMKGPAYVADAYELEDSDELEPDDKNKKRYKM
ncbi:MAG: hypothetical protein HKP12_00075 [Gammaproteobacteria bacterium]|nr:hypothetical protein [Gammaproteobacteria bacterium]